MIPRSVDKIFEHIEELKAKGWHYKCKMTYSEIYNEKMCDLLTKPGTYHNRVFLKIHQAQRKVYVKRLTEFEVNSSTDVYPLSS